MFETDVEAGVLRLARPDTRWLSTGFDGGFERADAAYNVTVPEGWTREDLATYATERRERAGFDEEGPTLLTGVSMDHARGARLGSVVAYATVGLSNPAALPMEPEGASDRPENPTAGTVNLVVGTRRSLDEGALASLVATVTEAKTATLLATAGIPGTTTDAVVVAGGDGEPASFVGSATEVGSAARACVREAIRASFRSRYSNGEPPRSVADAEYGVVTDERTEAFEP